MRSTPIPGRAMMRRRGPIGQSFDGTVRPYLLACAACALGGFAIIVLTEPKRLFAPIGPSPEAAPAPPEDLC